MTDRRSWRARTRGVVGLGCWVFALGCVAWLLFGHLWRHDPADASRVGGWLAFASLCAQAFSFHLGLAVLGAVLVALAVRARRAALLLVLLLLPTLGARAWTHAPWRGGEGPDPGDDTVTVFSANLLFGRADPRALMDQIDAVDPDVVLFQEYTPGSWGYETLLRERYPHAKVWPRDDAFGQAVFSRLPFTGEPELWYGPEGSVIPMIACEVEAHGRRIAVWNVHTLPPVGWRNTVAQRAMVAWVAGAVTDLMASDGAPHAVIAAGDFNAPYRTNHLRELRRAGLREAHDAVGAGAGATWPRLWWKRHFPGIRLDHVMFGGGIVGVHAGVGEDFGSDHRPVWAVLRLGGAD